jgi:hypothetical protein
MSGQELAGGSGSPERQESENKPQPISAGYTDLKVRTFAPFGGLVPNVCIGCATALTDSTIGSSQSIHCTPGHQTITFKIHICKSCIGNGRRPSDFFREYPHESDMHLQFANAKVAAIWKDVFTRQSSISRAAGDEVIRRDKAGSLSSGADLDALLRTVTLYPDIRIVSEQRFTPNTPNWQPPAQASLPCFVATACYGSCDHPVVWEFRWFRDHALATSPLGRGFVAAYYRLSPPIAAVLRKSSVLRAAVRRCVLVPLLFLVRHGNRRDK